MNLLFFTLGLFAATAPVRGGNVKRAGTYGAAYFMTDEPSGNYIIASEILADGKLAIRRAISTHGVGSHGISDRSTDPLFSQGSIQISSTGILAAVNPGSNTVSIFSAPSDDPSRLKQIGAPISTGGEFPVSVAFNHAGDVLCALNTGAVSGVSCFKVDETKGLINLAGTTRYLDLHETTPPFGPFGTASQLIFTEGDKLLVVAVKGTNATTAFQHGGYLAIWDVNADGSLSTDFRTVPAPQGALLPFSLTLIPGRDAILASDAGIGFEIYTGISGGNLTNSRDAPSTAYQIPGQGAVCWTILSKQTGNYYLSDFDKSIITEISIDDTLRGHIVKQYMLPNDSAVTELGISTVNHNDYLYVVSENATSIDVYKLNAPGEAKHTQRLPVELPYSKIPITGRNLVGMAIFQQ